MRSSCQLPPPPLPVPVFPLIVLYPLMKRWTWWPQAFLGITFNFGALMGWTAVTGRPDLPGLALTPVDLPGAEAKFDLTFTVHERDGALSGMVEGRGDLFEEATLGRLAVWLGTLLAGALADPALCLAELPLLTGAERAEQVLGKNDVAEDVNSRTQVGLFPHGASASRHIPAGNDGVGLRELIL